MREGMGSVATFNIIIIFIVLVFAFLASIISYSKSFRVNSKIVGSIEKYEGYNVVAQKEINNKLEAIGYRYGTKKDCPAKAGWNLVTGSANKYKYCTYKRVVNDSNNKYYVYGTLTYMAMDLPIVGKKLELPIFAKTNKIYRFGV